MKILGYRDWLQAELPEDLAELGDSSPSAVGALREPTRPWSWKVYAYKKKQVCSSELYFLRPAFARDTLGESLSQSGSRSRIRSTCRNVTLSCHYVTLWQFYCQPGSLKVLIVCSKRIMQ